MCFGYIMTAPALVAVFSFHSICIGVRIVSVCDSCPLGTFNS